MSYSTILMNCFLLLCIVSESDEQVKKINPIILVPGIGGNQLEAKLNRDHVISFLCEKKTSDYYTIWVNLRISNSLTNKCEMDNLKLLYDNRTRRTLNTPGVDIRVPGFGSTITMEYLMTNKFFASRYFHSIVKSLLSIGYERGKQLFGAPYDFRKGPNEMHTYFQALDKLVKNAYTMNNNQSVVLIAHSMGSKLIHVFLNMQDRKWKEKYIKCFISISGVWLGSIRAVQNFLRGDNFGIFIINRRDIGIATKTFGSLAFLLPHPEQWRRDQVYVSTPAKNYTVSDYKELFMNAHEENAYQMWKDVKNFSETFNFPEIPTYCIFGSGLRTIEGYVPKLHSYFKLLYNSLVYKTNNLRHGIPKKIFGTGDGYVNSYSLEACKLWASRKQNVAIYSVNNANHLSVLWDKRVLNYVTSILQSL